MSFHSWLLLLYGAYRQITWWGEVGAGGWSQGHFNMVPRLWGRQKDWRGMENEVVGWKLVFDGRWLVLPPPGGTPGLYGPPSAGCPDRALCSPGLVLHWSSVCLCVFRLFFLISAPWRVRMAEPCTQGWMKTLPEGESSSFSSSSSSSSKPGAEGNSSSTGSFSWVRT